MIKELKFKYKGEDKTVLHNFAFGTEYCEKAIINYYIYLLEQEEVRKELEKTIPKEKDYGWDEFG